MSIYDYRIKTTGGEEVSMGDYKGRVLLIVNTATRCGFTRQYADLQRLYDELHSEGFEILDFPCNQFGKQAPGSNEEIHEFCTLNFGIKFKQFAKIDVNGKDEDPLYTFLKKGRKTFFNSKIKWNFTKFLIDREGNVIGRFSATYNLKKIRNIVQKIVSAL